MVRKIRSREEETGRPEIGMDCVWMNALARCGERGRLSADFQLISSGEEKGVHLVKYSV